jgi:hypothetical protein
MYVLSCPLELEAPAGGISSRGVELALPAMTWRDDRLQARNRPGKLRKPLLEPSELRGHAGAGYLAGGALPTDASSIRSADSVSSLPGRCRQDCMALPN